MELWELILIFWAGPTCVASSAFAAWLLYMRFRPQRLEAVGSKPPGAWPRLSVIIPARNEADTLEAALSTLLAQTYPNLELVLIDDRSTDGTGAIVERMAARDPRIKPVHIESLPEGWLGKVHALHRGVELASGEWYLFTDADVHFGPDALERAVAHCLEGKRDFLAIIPSFIAHGLLQNATMSAFSMGFTLATRPDQIGREGSKAYVGVGAFNLVRAETYAKSEGLEWLRLELADDIGLGYVLHRAGARAALLLGGALISIDWYPNLRAMVRGFEKNAFPSGARMSWMRTAIICGAMISGAFAPFMAALQTTWPWLTLLGVATLGLNAAVHVRTARIMGVPVISALCTCAGLLVGAYALLRSAVICQREGGVRWRETWYSKEALRHGQRVKL